MPAPSARPFSRTVCGSWSGKPTAPISRRSRSGSARAGSWRIRAIREARTEPPSVATDLLFRLGFQRHPYMRDARGSPTVINHLNLDSLKGYFEKYYTPPNTTVVVVGDVQPAAIERQVRTAFGAEAPA